MIPRRVLVWLLAVGLSLPAAVTICWALAFALRGMADESGAAVLHRIALGLGALWLFDLAALVLALAWQQVMSTDERENSQE